jgi:plastocyanin
MRVLAKLSVIGCVIALAACGGGSTAPANNTGGGGGGGGGNQDPNGIDVLDNNFSPDSLAVAKGATVTWTWGGQAVHNVTFTDGTIGNSEDQATGTFSKSFANAGVFTYHCTHHAGMNGKIVVQ